MIKKYYDETDGKTLYRLRSGELKIFTASLPERPAPGDLIIIRCRDNAQITDFIECQIGTVTRAGISAHAFLLNLHVVNEPIHTGNMGAWNPRLSTIITEYRQRLHKVDVAQAKIKLVEKSALVLRILKKST